jgi:hypothetical protein
MRGISASSSQSTALPMQASCPVCSDSTPTRSISATQQHVSDMNNARKGIPYVSETFFANELVLEHRARRQVHRRAPNRVINRIKRDLWPRKCFVSDHRYHYQSPSQIAMGARTALDGSQLPSSGTLPTTKIFYARQYQHHGRIAPLTL